MLIPCNEYHEVAYLMFRWNADELTGKGSKGYVGHFLFSIFSY